MSTALPSSGAPASKRRLFRFRYFIVAALLVVLLAVGWIFWQVSSSQARLEGEVTLAGLEQRVTIRRDAYGFAHFEAASELDFVRGLGWVHAQERFFQMDLLRRSPAGEMAALVGNRLYESDAAMRPLRMRARATLALDELPADERIYLDAYTAGVNDGLRALGATPWEYLVLGSQPMPWRPEDSLLVLVGMAGYLQEYQALPEQTRALIEQHLPPAVATFLLETQTIWQASLDGHDAGPAPFPPAEAWSYLPATPSPNIPVAALGLPAATHWLAGAEPELLRGSNAWAVGPSRSTDGRAWLANDKHLDLSLPNFWFHLTAQFPARGRNWTLRGTTLPGVPVLATGSNGRVAWAVTNAGFDIADLILVEPDPAQPATHYLTPDGPEAFREFTETIFLRGEPSRKITFRETRWGPVKEKGPLGRPTVTAWVYLLPGSMRLNYARAATATDLDELLAVANACSLPVQNFLASDTTGRLVYTLAGALPDRTGYDGRRPVESSQARLFLRRAERFPRLADPAEGLLWSGNNVHLTEATLGEAWGGRTLFDARAWRIREVLRSRPQHSSADLHALQHDLATPALERWHRLFVDQLTPEALQQDGRLAALRDILATWQGEALPDSSAHHFVRQFRIEVMGALAMRVFAPIRAQVKDFLPWGIMWEEAAYQIAVQRPAAVAPEGWSAFLVQCARTMLDDMEKWRSRVTPDLPLTELRWVDFQRAIVRHPVGAALPLVGEHFTTTRDERGGDSGAVRALFRSFGASDRAVYGAALEQPYLVEAPGGQSGHPLSPFFRNLHDRWRAGEAVPLDPATPAVHTLLLQPTARR